MKNLFILFLSLISSKVFAQNSDTSKISTQINIDSVYTKVDEEAQFPGGEKNWNKLIKKTIENNLDQLMQSAENNGTCEIKFIVDTKGKISAMRATKMYGTLLAKIVMIAIEKGPEWIPAKFHGVSVKSIRTMKVTFRFP